MTKYTYDDCLDVDLSKLSCDSGVCGQWQDIEKMCHQKSIIRTEKPEQKTDWLYQVSIPLYLAGCAVVAATIIALLVAEFA